MLTFSVVVVQSAAVPVGTALLPEHFLIDNHQSERLTDLPLDTTAELPVVVTHENIEADVPVQPPSPSSGWTFPWTGGVGSPPSGDFQDQHSTVNADSLQQVVGFSYCPHLNLAVFDVTAPMKADVVAVLQQELHKSGGSKSSLLRQYILDRKLARTFSPLVDFDRYEIEEVVTARTTSIRDMGHREFVQLVDFVAAIIYHDVIARYKIRSLQMENLSSQFFGASINPEHAKRFACFLAADGHNEWLRLTMHDAKLLRNVEGRIYFGSDINFDWIDMQSVRSEAASLANDSSIYPMANSVEDKDKAVDDWNSINLKQKLGSLALYKNPSGLDSIPYSPKLDNNIIRPHKMAYFLMVHSNYESIVSLIEALIDPYVTILIHVDAKATHLKERLIQHLISECRTRKEFDRVRIMEKSFTGLWGYSSLVFSQLAGFFELLHMGADWEYVVNLSGSDYPLRTNDVIYEDLKTYGPGSFIQHWIAADAISRVNDRPVIASSMHYAGQPSGINNTRIPLEYQGVTYSTDIMMDITKMLGTNAFGALSFPFPQWQIYKHSQWLILEREFILKLKASPTAMYLAAFMEWSMIPDESYFATLARNCATFDKQVINDNKRFLEFPAGAPHPRLITSRDLPNIVNEVNGGTAWTRKVDMNRADSWTLIHGIETVRSWDHQRGSEH